MVWVLSSKLHPDCFKVNDFVFLILRGFGGRLLSFLKNFYSRFQFVALHPAELVSQTRLSIQTFVSSFALLDAFANASYSGVYGIDDSTSYGDKRNNCMPNLLH